MGLKNFKIWGVFLVAIVAIAFMLFQQSNSNKKELEGQAIRNMELVKGHFQYAFQSNLDKKLFSLPKDSLSTIEPLLFDLNIEGNRLPEFRLIKKPALLSIPLSDLFIKVDKHLFFEKIFLTDTSGKVIYPQNEVGKILPEFDNIESEPFRLPVIKHEIIYKDESYLLYFTPVVVENMRFFMAGVIKKSYYDSIGRRVDFSNLTILVFLLAVMLFSLPIIPVFGLQHGDKLTKNRVYNVGLSLVGIMVILGFGFSFFKNHHPISHEDHHKSIVDIQNNYRDFLDDKNEIIDSGNFQEKEFNEYVLIQENGLIDSMFYSNGDTILPKGIKLDKRKYFQYFVEKPAEPKFIPEKNQKKYIGSHYSLNSAVLESVISKLDTQKNRLQVVTFYWDKFNSKYDPIRRYILFKENGLVIQKSKKIDAPVDNLKDILSESKWKEIETIMKTNSDEELSNPWEIPLYLDGHAYEADMVLVKKRGEFDQPVWMIYLVDAHLEHVFSSLLTFESMILLLFYLSFLALISYLNKLIKPHSKFNRWEKFSYYYLFPNQQKSFEFMVMIRFFVFYSFLFVYFYNQPGFHFFSMFFLIIISTIHIKILMYVWLGPNWYDENHIQVLRNCLVLVCILVFPFYGLLKVGDDAPFWIMLTFVVFSVIATVIYKKRIDIKRANQPSNASKHFDHVAFKNLYVGFLMMWIFLIGFIPGYVVFSKVYNYEKTHWEEQTVKSDRKEPNLFWVNYDEVRRAVFGNLSSQYEPVISDFISLKRQNVEPQADQKKAAISFGFLETYVKKFIDEPGTFLFISLLFFILLSITIWILKTLIDKIYFLNFRYLPEWTEDKKFAEGDSPSRVFLCGSDTNLNLDWVRDKFNVKEEEIGIMDAILDTSLSWVQQIPDRLTTKSVWFIQNIHCYSIEQGLIDSLPLIMEKAKEKKAILILSSAISWKEINKLLETAAYRIRFSQIFSSFHFEYVPVIPLIPILDDEAEESQLLSNQRSKKAYFTNLWSVLSFDEKKVCYYFSMEGFFNFSNNDVIVELIQKGILIKTDQYDMPKLFSKTFRYFVLSNISSEELELFKLDEQKYGNVKSLQVAVFSFILLSVAIISYFDKNFLDQATTFVTGIAGAIGGIYSIFSRAVPSLKFGSSK